MSVFYDLDGLIGLYAADNDRFVSRAADEPFAVRTGSDTVYEALVDLDALGHVVS
jgi:hypothetical protein